MADRYDETRGGDARTANVTDALRPWLPAGRVLEIGVGTGAIAADLGRPAPLGVDLSMPMLVQAAARLGPRIAQGDVVQLPVRGGSLDAVVAVNVLHLLPDLPAALAEVARVLRPDAVLVASGLEGDRPSVDDITATHGDVVSRLRPFPLPSSEALEGLGWQVVHDGFTAPLRVDISPAEAADQVEARTWSWSWHVPDETWAAEVEPILEALRALPEPDRARERTLERRFAVLRRR